MTVSDSRRATLWRIEVLPRRADLDSHGSAVLRDVHELGFPHVQRVASSRVFLVECGLPDAEIARIAAQLLADPITESAQTRRGGDDRTLPGEGFDSAIEVHLKGGVMDPVAASARAAIADMGLDTGSLGLSTARLYRLQGVRSTEQLETIARRLLSNDCIEDVYLTGFGTHQPRPDHLPVAPERPFELRHVRLRDLDDAALTKLSREAHLFLSLEEMRAVQNHYRDQKRDPTDLELETLAQTWSEHCVHKTLKSAVRYRGAAMPTSSKAEQKPVGDQVEITYSNLLKETIARATHELINSNKVMWCLSVFEDNAGIVAFDADYGVAFKVETHNHPSAIEPYGGSATGIGGVIRDVMGCGLGAKPIANTDVFCVGTPNFPMTSLPKGVLHPRRVLKGVVSGVRDYGNRMGIPTINGAVVFDDRYLGNPLVFCGCLGLIPRDKIAKEPHPGDMIVVIGGRTGRDGIHGATFSSAELTDTHADEFSHAVQIGNAITEKQVLDAMLKARDYPGGCLYTATTDCGAGGLSSAVGEMAQKLGATVNLEKVPLKYAGLRYDEIWISEAQERMVVSVPPWNWDKLKAICDAENVEATVIGTFRDDGHLIIRYGHQTVGDIDVNFLHNGVPKTQKAAVWQPSVAPDFGELSRAASRRCDSQGGMGKRSLPVGSSDSPEVLQLLGEQTGFDFVDLSMVHLNLELLKQMPASLLHKHRLIPLEKMTGTLRVATADPYNITGFDELQMLTGLKIKPVLASAFQVERLLRKHVGTGTAYSMAEHTLRSTLAQLNTASKEWIIRQYDHEVQGASVVKPLVGPGQGPSDGAVIRPRLESTRGVAMGCGICPPLSDVDPYWMAVAAIDEAIRNVVCVGGSPQHTAILDNFCWGNCEDPQTMGALVRACQGCYDAAIAYETPFISGKDSLNNEFAIDPADAERLAGRIALHNNRIRIPGTLLVSAISLVNDISHCVTMDAKPAAPEHSRLFFVGLSAKSWPEAKISDAADLHRGIFILVNSANILAAHDCGDEGVLPALAEMAFAAQRGMNLTFDASAIDPFAPVACGYVLQVHELAADALKTLAGDESRFSLHELGTVTTDTIFRWRSGSESVEIDVAELAEAWRAPLRW